MPTIAELKQPSDTANGFKIYYAKIQRHFRYPTLAMQTHLKCGMQRVSSIIRRLFPGCGQETSKITHFSVTYIYAMHAAT